MVIAPWLRRALVGCVLGLAHAAGADPAPPQMLEGEAKEALRLGLLAAFSALPSVNQTYELTTQSPDEPATRLRIDLWREGDTGGLGFVDLTGSPDHPPLFAFTDGIVFAMKLGSDPATVSGPGVERLRQRHRTAEAASRTMHASWGTPLTGEAHPGLIHSLGVRPIPGEKPFKIGFSMNAGATDGTPSWLSADLWRAASVEQRPETGAVVLRELQVESTVRTQDGLLLRVEAHDEAKSRHVLLTLDVPTRTASDWRGRVHDACRPLHDRARQPHAVASWIDAGYRAGRVGALLRVPQEPAVPEATLVAWAQFLVDTEKTILALDDWTPETAAKQRDVVHKALLAAIRAMAPTAQWPAERADRFAAHVSARWAAVMEPPPAAPAEGGEAR